MAIAQVVELSDTNNSLSEDYSTLTWTITLEKRIVGERCFQYQLSGTVCFLYFVS